MGKSIGYLNVVFGANMAGFDKAMSKAQKKIGKFGKNMQRIGGNLSSTITLPVIGLGVAAVKMASDYEESLNKVKVSFGSTSKSVEDFAKTTLESFGIAEGSALEMASLFGDMGTSMGLSQKEAAKMSTELVGLAGDLASFKNIGIDQATTAIAGVFTGETESLKKLGIVMTQANLQQFAFTLGITKSIIKMTQAEKVALRYNFIINKSKNALGDFARTSDGVANTTRKLGETIKELGEQFGTLLLPLAKKVLDKFTELVTKFKNLDEEQKKSILRWAAIFAVIGPGLILVGKLSLGFVAISKAITGTIKALSLLRIAVLTNPITGLLALIGGGIAFLVYKLGTVNVAVKKNKKLYDDLVETREKLAKLDTQELKFLKIKQKEQLKIINAELQLAKQKLSKKSVNQNSGNALLVGPNLDGEGTPATNITLQTELKARDDLQSKVNKLVSSLKVINELLGVGNNEIKNQENNVENVGKAYSKQSDVMLKNIEDFAIKSKAMWYDGGFLEGPINGFKELTKAQLIAASASELFEDVLTGAFMDAAFSSENFFASFIKSLKKAITQLLIQLAVITAIKLLLGDASTVKDAFNLAKLSVLGLEKGGIVTGPTLSMIGEGKESEAVLPLSKLDNMLSNNSGNQKVEVFGRISGNDIFLSNSKSANSRLRSV